MHSLFAGYAPKEVLNLKSKESEEEFQSRAQLLQQRIEKLVADLNRDENEVVSITLLPYQGELPPPHIRHAGDTGFGTLTPDEYVEIRLNVAAKYA